MVLIHDNRPAFNQLWLFHYIKRHMNYYLAHTTFKKKKKDACHLQGSVARNSTENTSLQNTTQSTLNKALSTPMLWVSVTNDFWFSAVQVPEEHRWRFRAMKTQTNAFSSQISSLFPDLKNIKHIYKTIPCAWMSSAFIYVSIIWFTSCLVIIKFIGMVYPMLVIVAFHHTLRWTLPFCSGAFHQHQYSINGYST